MTARDGEPCDVAESTATSQAAALGYAAAVETLLESDEVRQQLGARLGGPR